MKSKTAHATKRVGEDLPPASLATRHEITFRFGVNDFPSRGEAVETELCGHKARIEWTDLHRPTGGRLFRMTWRGLSANPARSGNK